MSLTSYRAAPPRVNDLALRRKEIRRGYPRRLIPTKRVSLRVVRARRCLRSLHRCFRSLQRRFRSAEKIRFVRLKGLAATYSPMP